MEKIKEEVTRRKFLTKAGKLAAGVLVPPWVLTACGEEKTAQIKTTETKTTTPDLGLKLDEGKWLEALKKSPVWEQLPDATNKVNLKCPRWSPKICMGQVSKSFKIAINRPMAEYVFSEAKMTGLPVPTNIVFVEDWGQVGPESHIEGFTGLTVDKKELDIMIWLKPLIWASFLAVEKRKQSLTDYFQGTLCAAASSRLVHETAHAGAEFKTFDLLHNNPSEEALEAVHPQIYQFQNRYEQLYDMVGKQGLALNALLVGVEPVVDLNLLRQQIFQEASQKGLPIK